MLFLLYSTNWWRKFIVFGYLCLLVGCGDSARDYTGVTGTTMGTTYAVKVNGVALTATDLKTRIDKRLIALNAVLSTYIPDSELSQLNAKAADETTAVSADLRAVLEMSREVYEASAGAFDVTAGPLVNLWGFGPDGPRSGVPDDAQVREALDKVGYLRIRLTDSGVRKPPGMYIDLSAIAKGYAVDELAKLLESLGATDYMVEIGGEVLTRGRSPRGNDWVIGLEAPDWTERRLQRTLPARNTAVATSGDYRNFFEHGGEIYSHTIDPTSGWPVTHSQASVTVLHESAAMADGYATAFSVLGPDRTMALAEEMQMSVLAIIREGESYREIQSTELTRYLELK